MIRPIETLSVDVIPQAILSLPVQAVVRKAPVTSGSDDFDYYEGASFKLDNDVEIAVRHYRGHPVDTTTIYIDRSQSDVGKITMLIRKILNELDVPLQALWWERKDTPEL